MDSTKTSILKLTAFRFTSIVFDKIIACALSYLVPVDPIVKAQVFVLNNVCRRTLINSFQRFQPQ